jgi:hypothetical protein
MIRVRYIYSKYIHRPRVRPVNTRYQKEYNVRRPVFFRDYATPARDVYTLETPIQNYNKARIQIQMQQKKSSCTTPLHPIHHTTQRQPIRQLIRTAIPLTSSTLSIQTHFTAIQDRQRLVCIAGAFLTDTTVNAWRCDSFVTCVGDIGCRGGRLWRWWSSPHVEMLR